MLFQEAAEERTLKVNGHVQSVEVRVPRVCISDLSMLIIDNNHELDRILESMNLDEYELIDLPMEQPDDSSHEHTRVGMGPALDTGSTSKLATCGGSSMALRSGVDRCQWSSLFFPH